MDSGNFLIISDKQIPFHHPKALSFCRAVVKEYKIPIKTNIINIGDELDQYWGGLWDKDPDAALTANQEIQRSYEVLKEWYKAFPYMRLCESNHGTRWKRKAFAAQIPSQLMRRYSEVIQAPPTWKWAKSWTIRTKHPFVAEHGDDWGGQWPHWQAALHNGISTVIGHHHSKCGVERIKTNQLDIWGMVVGCLINFEAFAFQYARNAKFKPHIGVGVIQDNGKVPLWLPLS